MVALLLDVQKIHRFWEVPCGQFPNWKPIFLSKKSMSKFSCCLRRAESHRVKSQAPAPLHHVFFVLFRSWRQYAGTQCGKDKGQETPCGRPMKKHASRPSAKPFSQEIHEKTPCGRQMQANALRLAGKWSRPRHPAAETVWEITLESDLGKAGIRPRNQQENHCVETNEEKWRRTHRKMIRPKGRGAIISETNIWQTHKRNESSLIENDPAKTKQTIIWDHLGDKWKEIEGDNCHKAEASRAIILEPDMAKSLNQGIEQSHPGVRTPHRRSCFWKTWGSIGARFKPWSSWISFDNQGAESFHKVLHGIFHLVDLGNYQMTTTFFTRKNEKRMVKIEVGQQKNWERQRKPRKKKNTKHETARYQKKCNDEDGTSMDLNSIGGLAGGSNLACQAFQAA